MAVRAGGTRKLEQRLKSAAEDALPDTPSEAAEKVLELAALLNMHDRRTRGHSERVRVYADLVADELSLAPHERSRLHWAALLHDVGKLVVPEQILNKAGELNQAEWEILRRHPLEGERFIEPLRGWLGDWSAAIGEHHERYDGGGYPRGLAGQQISLAARIVAVADSYEVMTAARAYKKALTAPEARRELARCAGSQFDPNVVRAFLNISVGRLRLAMGPLAWLAQFPVVAQAPSLGSAASSAVGTAAAGVATSTAIVLGGVAEVPHVELAPPVPVTTTGNVVTEPPSSVVVTRPPAQDAPPPAAGGSAETPMPAPAAAAATTTPAATASSAPAPTTAAPTTVSAPAPTAAPTTIAPAPAPEPPPVAEPTTTKPPKAPTDSEADEDKGIGNDDRSTGSQAGGGAPAVAAPGG